MRYVSALLFLLFSSLANATTWIVSNVPGFPVTPTTHTSLQACITAAANGDIILVQGSGTNYGPIELSKQLIIMGPGYFLNQNPETQAVASTAKVEYILCSGGATGSIIQGLEVTSYTAVTGEVFPCPWQSGPVGHATINVDGCSVTLISVKTEPVGLWIHVRNSTGTTIQKCYGAGVFCGNNVSGLTIENSIFTYGPYVTNATIRNSLFGQDLAAGAYGFAFVNCNITNSILGQPGPFYNSGSTFNNNIFLNINPLGLNAGNNITDEDPANFFVGVPTQGSYSDDGKFKLRTGCVAIGTGVDNVDIGPYGGSDPYSPSGISFHPNIWKVTMPTTGTSGGGLQVQVKINANN